MCEVGLVNRLVKGGVTCRAFEKQAGDSKAAASLPKGFHGHGARAVVPSQARLYMVVLQPLEFFAVSQALIAQP
jgi:hypothetical protein